MHLPPSSDGGHGLMTQTLARRKTAANFVPRLTDVGTEGRSSWRFGRLNSYFGQKLVCDILMSFEVVRSHILKLPPQTPQV